MFKRLVLESCRIEQSHWMRIGLFADSDIVDPERLLLLYISCRVKGEQQKSALVCEQVESFADRAREVLPIPIDLARKRPRRGRVDKRVHRLVSRPLEEGLSWFLCPGPKRDGVDPPCFWLDRLVRRRDHVTVCVGGMVNPKAGLA